jgi:lipoprotein-releasing system permease protein
VASLALVADLALIIAAKQREIGMLGAMGAPAAALRRAFLLLGALLAALGIAAGGLLGTALAWVLDTYRLLPVPGQVYFIDYVPFLVRGRDLAAVVGLTVLLVGLSSLYAARRATALSPVEALGR